MGSWSWLSGAAQFWNDWGVRVVVLSSFAANAVLFLLADVRRRRASGWRTLLLWLAYQLADLTATYALGNLSLSRGAVQSMREHELVAFWAPFLLLHLGGPDNMSAYALEDNKLSLRQGFHLLAQVAGAAYVTYKHVYLRGSGTLVPASFIMLPLAVAKYVERVCALRRGDLRDIRRSSSQQQGQKKEISETGCCSCCTEVGNNLGNEKALILAHKMFHVCKRAMVDSSVNLESSSSDDDDHGGTCSEMIFQMPWKSMCKVVEMELSLMYDILYTKASVVYTWGGYLIRFISPLATATAISLFWTYPKAGQRRGDVIITYILLVAAFLLDLRWLVRALGSTWTFAFLKATRSARIWRWRWRRLRRGLVSVHPCRLLGKEPSSYRLWPSTIGRFNLLHECTHDRGGRCPTRLCTALVTAIGLEDTWNEFQHSRCLSHLPRRVKKLVFQRIQHRLRSSRSTDETASSAYSMKDITTLWGDKAFRRRPSELRIKDFDLSFGREFQEDILVWHIGTCIFLSRCADQQLIEETNRMKPAIEALSEYLMFLVAVRRHMLPGLALRSLFEVTREALDKTWVSLNKTIRISSAASRKDKLAKFLYETKYSDEDWGLGDANRRLLADGVELAIALLLVDKSHMSKLLELIFDVWVDKLLYAGMQCSRESHAKQLSRGGELTTIVWIMAEHAGLFRIGETTRDKPEEKKKKEEEEKKKKKEAEEKKKKEEEEKKKKQQEYVKEEEEIKLGVPAEPIEPERTRKKTRRIKYATLYPAR